MDRWNTLPEARPDPIFAIAEQARAAGPEAINATIGIYMDEQGETKLFPSVRSATEDVLKGYADGSFSYGALLGISAYRTAVEALVFPGATDPIASIATTGGTGALAINLRVLKLLDPDARLGLPVPAWANHAPLCRMADVAFEELAVLEDHAIQHETIIEWVRVQDRPCALLLQAGCNNPTGIDLSASQWEALVAELASRDCTVLLDFAYQGFAGTPEEDATPARMLAAAGIPTLVSWSAAKNHAIYRLRTGLALASLPNEEAHTRLEQQYSMLSRGLWSAAPTLGQQIVAQTQLHHAEAWRTDLAQVRATLQRKRSLLCDGLPEAFHAPLSGNGLFAVLPLQPEQIRELRERHKVFFLEDGRVNIAGIPEARISECCEKIQRVL